MSKDNTQSPQEIFVNLMQAEIIENGVSISQVVHFFSIRRMIVLAVEMIAFIMGVIATFGYCFITKPNSSAAATVMSYNYNVVVQDVDPLGRVLDVNKIKSLHTIDQAMQELDRYEGAQ